MRSARRRTADPIAPLQTTPRRTQHVVEQVPARRAVKARLAVDPIGELRCAKAVRRLKRQPRVQISGQRRGARLQKVRKQQRRSHAACCNRRKSAVPRRPGPGLVERPYCGVELRVSRDIVVGFERNDMRLRKQLFRESEDSAVSEGAEHKIRRVGNRLVAQGGLIAVSPGYSAAWRRSRSDLANRGKGPANRKNRGGTLLCTNV